MATLSDLDAQYEEQGYESGYLLIYTTYTPDPSSDKDSALIEANSQIANAVQRIIEKKGGCVKGSVVESFANDDRTIFVMVSLRAFHKDWGEYPLQAVAGEIMEFLGDGFETNSSISVDNVDVAKAIAGPMGLQGPP